MIDVDKVQAWGLGRRALVFGALLLALSELAHQGATAAVGAVLPFTRGTAEALRPGLQAYEALRASALARPAFAFALGAAGLLLAAGGLRAALLLWHNVLLPRLSGTAFQREAHAFPPRAVDLEAGLARRKAGSLFLGVSPRRGLLGWRWAPVELTPGDRAAHRHVLGKTGSGKTHSVLWPAILQDALDGRGVLFIDAKGSDESLRTFYAVAARAGRSHQVRVLALPAWNRRQRFSHRYNPVHVRPRTPTDSGGDPQAMAERVFRALPMGDNDFYNVQAQLLFFALCQLLHGMVDAKGVGLPFTLKDLCICVKGVGDAGAYGAALEHCLRHSTEKGMAREIRSQVARLGRDATKTFTGLVGALDRFNSPLVNAYAPDIVFEEVLEEGLLVYAQLPSNLMPVQAPALGKLLLSDVQQEGSYRQVERASRSQRPFSVVIDEFATFADQGVIDSLNKLRDAHLEYTLAHQSISDLERVSKEFASAVWDNTRCKDVLAQDSPELCEKLARSIGTHQLVEVTVRRRQGALWTSLATGDASTKLVEVFRLHPNAIKTLAHPGQGYLYAGNRVQPVMYAGLPEALARGIDPPAARTAEPARGLHLTRKFLDDFT